MKNSKSQKTPRDIAYDLYNEVTNCMYDLTLGVPEADRDGEADRLFNDANTLSDLFGDRIYEACNFMKTDDDLVLTWEVTDALLEIGKNHVALKVAIINFKKRHELI